METSTSGRERLTARVQGRVQGVGFRYFTRQEARRRGLTGWVRNEPDGAVRLVAEGPRGVLEAFLEAVRQGPSAAVVREVTAEWEEATGEFEGFATRYF